MKFYELEITDIVDEFDNVKTYILEKPKDFNWDIASNTHIGLDGFKAEDNGGKVNKDLVHHYSISSLSSEDKISFSTRFRKPLSIFKSELLKYKVGDKVTLFKTNTRMPIKRENKNIVLISMGIGLASFRTSILELIKNNKDVLDIYNLNISKDSDVLFRNELSNLSNEFFTNIWTNNRENFYLELDKLIQQGNSLYYIVGSDFFVKYIIKYLLDNNIDEDDIVIDKKINTREEFFKEVKEFKEI